jgi:hypothetical protein
MLKLYRLRHTVAGFYASVFRGRHPAPQNVSLRFHRVDAAPPEWHESGAKRGMPGSVPDGIPGSVTDGIPGGVNRPVFFSARPFGWQCWLATLATGA